MIVVVDNYDSFTYNLVDLLLYLPEDVRVVRNDDAAAIEVLFRMPPTAVVISPGPGRPEDAGLSPQIVKKCQERSTPVLGVCLGHQLIAQMLGANIVTTKPFHGKTSVIHWAHDNELTANIPTTMTVMRYHSLVIDPRSLPENLACLATTEDGEIMAIQCKNELLTGVQFHPESILTAYGKLLIENWYRTVNFYALLRNQT